GLAGSHESRRADDLALDGQAGIVGRVPGNPGGARLLFLRLIQEFGQPPVEDDDLAEVAEDYVVALEIAMKDVAGMGVGDGLANGGESRQKVTHLPRLPLPPPHYVPVTLHT